MAVLVKSRSSRSLVSTRDFTIYDSANSAQKHMRFAKANKCLVTTTIDESEDPLEDELASVGKPKQESIAVEQNVTYADYNIDVWCRISEFVRPEDVGRFALICRKTSEVVQTAKFWKFLYRKYFDRNVDLPRTLRIDCMPPLLGLRPRVIRSLFYLYPPFVHRIAASPFNDPHRVDGRQLVFSWSKKTAGGWNYYFKLRSRLIPGSRVEKSAKLQRSKDSLECMRDIYMNADEGCQILIVSTNALHLIPQYHEQVYVKSYTQTLAQGLTSYNVRLDIENYCRRVVDRIVLAPVRLVQLLDWWHPDYYKMHPTMDDDVSGIAEEDSDERERTYWDD